MDENVSLPLSEDGWEWETDAGAEYGPGGLDGERGPGGEGDMSGEADMSGGDPGGEGDCRDAAGARSEAVGQNIADGLGGAAGTPDRGGPGGAVGSPKRRDFGSAERGTDGAADMSGGNPGGKSASDDPGAGALPAADGTVTGTAGNNAAEASGAELRSPDPDTEGEYHARFGGKLPAPGQSAALRFAPPPVPGAGSIPDAAASAGAQVPLGAQAPAGAQMPVGAQVPLGAQVPFGAAAPQTALLAAQEARQRRQRDFVDFFRSRPDVQARDIPEQVYRQVQQGVPLLTAYTAWENRSLRAQLAAQRQNEMNRGRAVSAAASSGKSTASDQWARAWDSD